MNILAFVFQADASASSYGFTDYLLGVLLVIVAGAIGYYVSRFLTGRRFRREQKTDRKRMFDIEKALKDFWEHERAKLSGENRTLSEKITFLEKQVEEYRRKAAGVGIMGLSKDKRTDMLLQLMLENEALEEKLYELNLKMKEERDEFLTKQIKDISYKRIMLSEILKEQGVQDKIREILSSDQKLKRLKLPASPEPAPDEEGEPAQEEPPGEEEGS